MITKLPQSAGPTIGFEITGKIDAEAESSWIAGIEETIKEHGPISALVYLKDDARWGVKAGIEDIKWIMGHMKNVKKVAVVADSAAWKWLIAMDSKFAKMFNIDEKYFTSEQIDEAWSWLKN